MKHIKCDIEWLKEPEPRSYASDPHAQAALTEVEADAKRRRDELQFIQHRLEQPPIDWASLRPLLLMLVGVAIAVACLWFGTAHAEWTAPKYDCRPKTQEEYHIKKVGTFAVGIFDCDLPNKIKFNYYFGDPANIPDLAVVPSISKIFDFLQGNMKRGPTPEELAIIDAFHEEVGVKLFVAPLTGKTDRPIYKATATNTRGTDTGLRAKVLDSNGNRTRCGYKRLQDATGKATNYFDIPGGYTLCDVVGVVTK